jgi:hypothetical protein
LASVSKEEKMFYKIDTIYDAMHCIAKASLKSDLKKLENVLSV